MTDKTNIAIEYTLYIPKTLYQRLEALAIQHSTSLEQMILSVLNTCTEQTDDEDKDDDIKASLLEAWHQLHIGIQGRPIQKVLAELKAE